MTETITVIINGANGKMGSEAVAAVNNDPVLNLVAALGRNDDLGKTIRETNAMCVVDFTTPSTVFENTKTILENDAHPVIGTTGLTMEQIGELQKLALSKQLGGIIAPNFSIGAILMMQFAKRAAAFFPDVEIIEMHHEKKKDAPSGTAIKTAELIAENLDSSLKKIINCQESHTGALGAKYKNIPIHSVRLPGFVAHQQVIFGGADESLTIRHDTIHRKCFMPGVVLACKKAPALTDLVYGLEHVIF